MAFLRSLTLTKFQSKQMKKKTTLQSSLSIIFPLFFQALTLSSCTISVPPILQDVLNEISTKQKWNLDELNFTKLDVKKIRVGTGRKFKIRIRFNKTGFVFLFPDQVTDWRRVGGGVELNEVVSEINSTMVLGPIVLDGPFELRVADDDDRLSLALPMNISHSGLKRVLVSEGISVEIREAQEVSLYHSSQRRFAAAVDHVGDREGTCLWSFVGSVCLPLPPIQITGSASLVAFRTLNADSEIKASYLSDGVIQLLSDKCYSRGYAYRQNRLPTNLLGLKIDKLEKVLSSLGNGNRQMGSSVTAKLKASGIIRFQLEIERSIGRNESAMSKIADWRTKPKIERVWFEVTAKVEADKLKAMGTRKVAPFIHVDTEAWSSLMSNISFTKFPSILGPQEALTLGIKW